VYQITPSGNFTTLYPFDLSHGATPWGPLVQGTDGNFYGTTSKGGTGSGGVVFKITPAGKLTVLHNFCSHPAQMAKIPLVLWFRVPMAISMARQARAERTGLVRSSRSQRAERSRCCTV
jgi:uncharacterized repeat protein (TIGR03803 family)